MKTIYLGLILIAMVIINYCCSQDESLSIEQHSEYSPDNVAYDWENDRYITKKMADTMTFTSGTWYNNSQLPNTKPQEENINIKEPRWIKPAGKYYRKGSDNYEYKLFQESEYNPQPKGLTEDDVRQLIITEFDR